MSFHLESLKAEPFRILFCPGPRNHYIVLATDCEQIVEDCREFGHSLTEIAEGRIRAPGSGFYLWTGIQYAVPDGVSGDYNMRWRGETRKIETMPELLELMKMEPKDAEPEPPAA